jgi:F-type H+-transporting ATPase subunit a
MHEGIHITLKADTLFTFLGFPITNTLIMSWIVILILISGAYFAGRRIQKIPTRIQTFFEVAFSFFIDYAENVFESRTLAMRYVPFLATLFFFILLGNLLGLFPLIGSLYFITEGGEYFSFLHPIATDLNITIALALVSFIVIHASGVMIIGVKKYIKKFFNFSSPMGFFLGIIEFISEFVKIISFSFRLFGNMLAGKVLLLVVLFFIPYIVPVPLILYEVLVGFVQATIFTLLTLFFIKLAISEHH